MNSKDETFEAVVPFSTNREIAGRDDDDDDGEEEEDDDDDDDEPMPAPRRGGSPKSEIPALSQVAGTSKLGAFVDVHTYRKEGKKNLLIWSGSALLFAAAGPVGHFVEPEKIPMLAMLTAPVFGILVIYFLMKLISAGRYACQIHQRGMVYRNGSGRIIPIPYNSIRAIRFNVVHVTGDQDMYEGIIELAIEGDERLKIPVELDKSIDIVNAVMAGTIDRMRKQALAEIDAGKTVSFGAVTVDGQSVTLNRQKMLWRDGFVSEWDGKIAIRLSKSVRGKDTVASTKRESVENWHVLKEISGPLRSRNAVDDDDNDDDDDFEDDDE